MMFMCHGEGIIVNAHERIVYENGKCPLCKAQRKIRELEEEAMRLRANLIAEHKQKEASK